ncbi:MAG: lipopolysaccharide heptosyltransferase II [Aureliella sp.]
MTNRIAVLMPSWVGDAAMATPTLRSLAKLAGSRGAVVGVMQPVVSQLLRGSSCCSEEIVFSKRSLRQRSRLVKQLRSADLDAIVLLTNSVWTAAVAYLARIPMRVGYARDGRGWLLTHRLSVPRRAGHKIPVPAIDYYLRLAEVVGGDASDRRMNLAVEASDEQLADRLWQKIGFSSSCSTVVINSSGAWGAAKLWPADHVEHLARRIAENHPWQVLLHCGPSERADADAVAARVDHPQVRSMGAVDHLPIGLTKAVMARAAAVVSTDSGPRHIAVALDRPVVSLFGPTDPAWTTTYNTPEAELGLNIPCRGCWKKSCPLEHHRCMRDLGVETVYGSLVAAMQRGVRWRAA